jgi:hypothetical protein
LLLLLLLLLNQLASLRSSRTMSLSTEQTTATPDNLFVTDPEKWLQETAHGCDLLCLVIFCNKDYDKHYLHRLGLTSMTNVKLVAWTSQDAKAANKANTDWKLTADYKYSQVLGDETNALANYLIEDQVLPDLHIETSADYPNGMAWPAMVWYAHHGSIVLQWSMPSAANLSDRPDPATIYQHVLKRKHALDHGNAIMPIHGSDIKMCKNDHDVDAHKCTML